MIALRENSKFAGSVLAKMSTLPVENPLRDSKFVENLSLLFFDNLYQDTSKSSDTNLPFYNLLRAFY